MYISKYTYSNFSFLSWLVYGFDLGLGPSATANRKHTTLEVTFALYEESWTFLVKIILFKLFNL